MTLHRSPTSWDAADFEFHAAISLSGEALARQLDSDASPGAEELRRFVSGPADDTPLERSLTPTARLALESIRRCPFVGACRTFALSARANDLLVEFLSTLSIAPARPAPTLATLTARIEAAAARLREEIEHPPSLTALARHVGLSESTLKRGFHQVFGTTPFSYLRARRMDRARELLEAGTATVLEAAALVGYSNPSNFAAAFRAQFGLNPKEYQLSART